MIKFFRKIRQNLLSEGKIGKYLKYAIGEIVLVVFGILIALGINNWNNNKQEKNNIIDSYKSIETEIEFLNPIIEYQYKRNDSTIAYLQKAVNLLQNKKYESVNQLNNNLKGLNRLIQLKYDFPVILGFIERTNPELIENKKLLNLLQDFKSKLTFLDFYQSFAINEVQNSITPYIIKNLKYDDNNTTILLTDKKQIIDNIEIINLLNKKLGTDRQSSQKLSDLLETMQKLKSEIQSELKNK